MATEGGTPLAKSARISVSGEIFDRGLVLRHCSPRCRLHPRRLPLPADIGDAARAGAIAACISTAAAAAALSD